MPSSYKFLILTIAVIAVMTLAPPTGWIVRSQMIGSQSLIDKPYRADKAMPLDDFRARLATTTRQISATDTDAEVLNRFQALASKFPNNPAIYANYLRLAMIGDRIFDNRDEPALLQEKTPAPRRSSVSPELLQHIDDAAAAGERLDPSNAFFPAMKSVSLFAAHRDAEALAAIARAGRATTWNEYVVEDVQGSFELADAQMRGKSGMSHLTILSAELFPDYARLRQSAQTAVYLAMRREISGDLAGGLAIRVNLMRIGELMRSRGNLAICSLVGIAITQLAIERPGGAPIIKSNKNNPDEALALRVQAFRDYLNAAGRGDLANSVTNQMDASRATRTVIRAGIDQDELMAELLRADIAFATGWVLIQSVTWFVCAIAAAKLISTIRASGIPIQHAQLLVVATAMTGLGITAIIVAYHARLPVETLPPDAAPSSLILVLVTTFPALAFGLASVVPSIIHRKPVGNELITV